MAHQKWWDSGTHDCEHLLLLLSTWEICINWIVSEDLILAEWLHLTERMLVKTDGASPGIDEYFIHD